MPTATAQNDRRKRRLPIWLLLTVCGVAFLLLTLLIAFYRGRANIRQDAADTLALVKSTCQKYDDYHLSSTTKDLQSLINKARVFGLYVPPIPRAKTFLRATSAISTSPVSPFSAKTSPSPRQRMQTVQAAARSSPLSLQTDRRRTSSPTRKRSMPIR